MFPYHLVYYLLVLCYLIMDLDLVQGRNFPSLEAHELSGNFPDLFLAEFPRHLSFRTATFTDSRTKSAFTPEEEAIEWVHARLIEIATSRTLIATSCREKAICQTAKYLRRLVPQEVRQTHLLDLPKEIFGSDDSVYEHLSTVWRRSLSDSMIVPSRSDCARVYPCDASIDVNYVPIEILENPKNVSKSYPELSLPSNHTFTWILDQVERIAFHSPNLTENCRVQAIAQIAKHIYHNSTLGINNKNPTQTQAQKCSTPICAQLISKHPVARRFGVNKFSEAWHYALRIPTRLDHEYPCKAESAQESALVQQEVNFVLDFIKQRDQRQINR